MQNNQIVRNAVLVLCVLVVLLVLGQFAANRFLPSPMLLTVAQEPPPADLEPVVEERGEIFVAPVRLRIPSLNLDYEIQGTGADQAGTMQVVPSISVISWYKQSAIPGNAGNTILAGHNTWRGERSPLYTMDELPIGSEMAIEYEDGSVLYFMLESVFVYKLKTAPVDKILDLSGDARVTLITCKPPFNLVTGTSDNRIVAVFKEERDFVIPDPPIEPFPPRA